MSGNSDALRALIDPETRRRLHQPNPRAVANAFAGTLAGFALVFAIALGSGHPAGYAVAFVLAIAVQTHMAVLMHEAAHGLVARSRSWNDRLTDWGVVYPLGMTVARYRQNHLPHHARLGSPADPDFTALCIPPMERGLAASVVGCLLGGRHLQLLAKFARGGVEARPSAPDPAAGSGCETYTESERIGNDILEPNAAAGGSVESLVGRGLWHGGVFALCWLAGQPWAYLIVWLLPLVTFGVLINELRTVVEHTPLCPEPGEGATPVEPVSRTVRPGFVGRHWIGSLNFHLHHEHHRLAGVPFSRLPELHAVLRSKGYYDRHPDLLCNGYVPILRRLWRRYRRERVAVAAEGGRYVARRV